MVNTLSDYQNAVVRTMGHPTVGEDDLVPFYALGLAWKTDEVLDVLKKGAAHGKTIDTDHILGELGDVMFYLTGLVHMLGTSLNEIANRNVDKRKERRADRAVDDCPFTRGELVRVAINGCSFVAEFGEYDDAKVCTVMDAGGSVFHVLSSLVTRAE